MVSAADGSTKGDILERFVQVLCCVDRCFIADDLLEQLPTHSVVRTTRVGGVDLNKVRMTRVIGSVVSLALKHSRNSALPLRRTYRQSLEIRRPLVERLSTV